MLSGYTNLLIYPIKGAPYVSKNNDFIFEVPLTAKKDSLQHCNLLDVQMTSDESKGLLRCEAAVLVQGQPGVLELIKIGQDQEDRRTKFVKVKNSRMPFNITEK